MRDRGEEFEEKAGRRGNLLRLFWYISLGMLVLGYVIIFFLWFY